MAWSLVGVGTAVTVTTTSHALTEPAGVQQGDLLIAVISSRIASTTAPTLPSGWRLVRQHLNNNVLATSAALPSGTMAMIVRGASAPALTFTHPVAPSVAIGRIIAYRGNITGSGADSGINRFKYSTLDQVAGATTATAITAVSVTGLTTGESNELIVAAACGGLAGSWSAFDAVTDPGTGSGATDTATAPTAGTWIERADSSTATGATTCLAIADAIRATGGATGNFTCTASAAAGHVFLAASFIMETTTRIQQTGSTLQFIPATTNSGTVSTTITVPADADFMLVGWSGSETTFTVNGYLTGGTMTFTKGGTQQNMVITSTASDQNVATRWSGALFYMVKPDTGTNKTLTWDWAGTNAQAPTALCSITFWKGVDPNNPVSQVLYNGNVVKTYPWQAGPLNSNIGDLIVAFVAGYVNGANDYTYGWNGGLQDVTQLTSNGNADGGWGFRRSPGSAIANLGVGDANYDDGGVIIVTLVGAKSLPLFRRPRRTFTQRF